MSRSAATWSVAVILSLLPVTMAAQGAIETAGNPAGAPVREIDDPNSGARWLLYPAKNGGPGRLVLTDGFSSQDQRQESAAPILPRPVIRAGDRIVLEEHTSVVDATLEAIALGPAVPGGALRVRLFIGGRVVSAVALAPGRAAIPAEKEMQP